MQWWTSFLQHKHQIQVSACAQQRIELVASICVCGATAVYALLYAVAVETGTVLWPFYHAQPCVLVPLRVS